MDRSLCIRLFIAITLLLATLWFGFQQESSEASDFVRRNGYWFTLFSGMGFVAYLGLWMVPHLHASRHAVNSCLLKPFLVGLVTVIAGSAVVFHGPELDYKILMDDYLLAATAKSLHETGEVAVAEFGRTVEGQFVVIQSFVDKRPWFYPFLVSVVHDVFGYHSLHPFIVNAVVAVLFLAVVFIIGYFLGDVGGGILAVLLWSSLPLLQQNATGGGMEMTNLLFIHIVILLSICYLRSPCARAEGTLCLAGVLLTYSRYESGLFLAAILCVIVLGWRRKGRVFLSLPALCAAPLLLAVFLQTRIYALSESSWELTAGVTAPFAVSHLWHNLPHMFAFFWSRDPAIANSILLGYLALPAILGFAYLCLCVRKQEWWSKPVNQVWTLFALFLVLNLVVVLCFHASKFDQRYVARYSLPTHSLIIFSLLACLAYLKARTWRWTVFIVVTIACLLTVTLPKNAHALYTKANFMVAEQHWLETLDQEVFGRGALIVDRFNATWTLRERAALSPRVALLHSERIRTELSRGQYRELFLVERLVVSNGGFKAQVPTVESLKEVFDAELIAEKCFRAGDLTRVYRLKP